MAANPDHADEAIDDITAIKAAIRPLVTATPERNNGYGLAFTRFLMEMNSGRLIVWSGEGWLGAHSMTTCTDSKMRLADDYGQVLSGRDLAEAIKDDLVRRVQNGGSVVVDFDEVLAVSPSFADEFFAKLPDSVAERVKFTHVSEHLQAVASMARAGRSENANGSA